MFAQCSIQGAPGRRASRHRPIPLVTKASFRVLRFIMEVPELAECDRTEQLDAPPAPSTTGSRPANPGSTPGRNSRTPASLTIRWPDYVAFRRVGGLAERHVVEVGKRVTSPLKKGQMIRGGGL